MSVTIANDREHHSLPSTAGMMAFGAIEDSRDPIIKCLGVRHRSVITGQEKVTCIQRGVLIFPDYGCTRWKNNEGVSGRSLWAPMRG